MTLADVSRQTGKPYTTLHGHVKAGILKVTKVKVNKRTRIEVTEADLMEYLKHEEMRDLMTHDIMSRIMLYVDGKLGERVIDKMSDEVNNTFQLKIESGIAYLLRKLKC